MTRQVMVPIWFALMVLIILGVITNPGGGAIKMFMMVGALASSWLFMDNFVRLFRPS